MILFLLVLGMSYTYYRQEQESLRKDVVTSETIEMPEEQV